jgi:hypothetical protein
LSKKKIKSEKIFKISSYTSGYWKKVGIEIEEEIVF